MNPSPWLIYTRVSTEDQAETGISLDAQLTACRAYSVAKSWTVTEEISDRGASASTFKREGIQRVLERLKSGEVAGVIAWRLDRLTRSIRDLLTLMDLTTDDKVGVVSVTESLDTTTPMGRFVVHLLGAIAQWERETIGARTKAAVHHARKQGFYTGGPVPAGAQVVIDGPRRRLQPGPGADLIRQAWEWILGGQSLGQVSDRLNTENVPHLSRNKLTPWTPSNVRQTLLSPQLAGVLVTPAIQAKLRAVLSQRATPMRGGDVGLIGKRSAVQPLLSGMFRCPICDRSMVQATANGRGGSYRYFRCVGKSKRTCKQKDLRCEPIEKAVIKAIQQALEPEGEYHQGILEQIEHAKVNIDVARKERLQLTGTSDQLRGRISDLALRHQIGAPGWDQALTAVGAELHRVDQRIAELSGQIAAADVDHQNLELSIAAIAAGVQSLHKATPDEQRAAVAKVLCQVRLDGKRLVLDLYAPKKHEPPRIDAVVRTLTPKWVATPHGKRTVRVTITGLLEALAKVPSGTC